MWNLPTAIRISHALEEFKPFWNEDPIKMDNVASLADYRRQTRIAVCASETLATRTAFRALLAAEAVDIVMLDLSWCGGLSEGRKIAALDVPSAVVTRSSQHETVDEDDTSTAGRTRGIAGGLWWTAGGSNS